LNANSYTDQNAFKLHLNFSRALSFDQKEQVFAAKSPQMHEAAQGTQLHAGNMFSNVFSLRMKPIFGKPSKQDF
jgi:hypothetical protein